jgi:hypothetical protein
VHPTHGIRRGERQRAGQELEASDAQGVVVSTVVEVAIHPSGLLGRHIRERALLRARVVDVLMLVRALDRGVEVDQLHLARAGIDQDISRLDVLVDDVLCMQDTERTRDRRGHTEEEVQSVIAFDMRRRPPTEVLDDQRDVARGSYELERAQHAWRVQLAQNAELELELRDVVGVGVFARDRLDHYRSAIGLSAGAAHERAP